VYVVPFGHGSGKWQISADGGLWPRWRQDGKEIFFAALDLKMMAAEIVETDATLSIGKVLPLFQMNPVLGAGNAYDVTPDGKKFIVNSGTAQESTAPLTLVVNWTSLLKK
jgi:eukaryotic-like serine/threonine-protein kinase